MREDIIFFDQFGDHLKWYENLVYYFKDSESIFLNGSSSPSHCINALSRSKHAFIWNGECPGSSFFKEACILSGVSFSIMEVGYFPQSEYFVLDREGLNATSELMSSDLSFVGSYLLDQLQIFRDKHVDSVMYTGEDKYTLVPLQLSSDTNITNNSPFKTMQPFINHCEEVIDGDILFKKHPLDPHSYETSHTFYGGDCPFPELAKDASLVYGINSTCLLESLLQKVPTLSIGKGFITKHEMNTEKLLAALIEKQIPIGSQDLEFWVGRYSNYLT